VKVLVSWLRDLVEIPVDAETLARDLHLTGFEVASVEVGTVPGQASAGTVPTDDAVIDFEITANRPDCLSLVGLAREVATKYGTALKPPLLADLGAPAVTLDGLDVTIEDAVRCPRYCAAIAEVTIGPSPAWLADRLNACGIRSISNIVDATNYVLLELGHPMHAFDLTRLVGGHLHIRLARTGERLKTLDGQERTLNGETLVIADEGRAQAIGGVMGGADSEVSRSTRTVALESAWFQPQSIRRTSRRLGLSTEASYRFERGADIAAAPVALARVAALLEQIGAGRVRPGWLDRYPAPRAGVTVPLTLARITQVLGVDVVAAEVERILAGLGFTVASTGTGAWQVTVPTWRADVSRDVDLVEEIARHHGYDRLPTTFPALDTVPARPDARLARDHSVRRLAISAGFSECVTFSFIAEKAAREFADGELVPIANPLSETFAILRPSLLPGLVDSLAHNRRHGRRDARLFELGTRFQGATGERRGLALGWLGTTGAEHWSGKPRQADFFDMSGAVETLAAALGLQVALVPARRSFLSPGRTAEVIATAPDGRRRTFGVVGQLLPALATARDVPAGDEIYLAELDLDEVADLITILDVPRARPLPRYPSIVRDLSILVADTLPAADVRGTIQASAPATLVRVAEFDRYQGKGIPDGQVSLSYRLTFQAPDRTLTDGDADEAMRAIVGALQQAHGAVQR
jgi:phenylalanyl-tRNA synthetase beta chain